MPPVGTDLQLSEIPSIVFILDLPEHLPLSGPRRKLISYI